MNTIAQTPSVPITRRLNGYEKKMLRYSALVCLEYLRPYCKFELGWNRQSVAFLSTFIDHHFHSTSTYLSNGITVSMAGAYLGECIISTYSGRWVSFCTGSIEVSVSSLFLVNPIQMVESHHQMHNERTVLNHFDWVAEAVENKNKKWTE